MPLTRSRLARLRAALRGWCRKAVAVALVTPALALACASWRADLTPEQRAWAAVAEYNVVLQLAVAYAEHPSSDPAVVDALVAVDVQAQAVVSELGRLLEACRTRISDGVGCPPDSEPQLKRGADLLVALAGTLRRELARVRLGPVPGQSPDSSGLPGQSPDSSGIDSNEDPDVVQVEV